MRQSNFTFSSRDAARLDVTTGYVDWIQVRKGAGVLLSIFGYNSGAEQYLQIFDAGSGAPTGTITKGDQSSWDEGQLPIASHNMQDGDKLVITDLTGFGTDIYFVHRIDANSISLHTTLEDALADVDRVLPDTGEDEGTFTHVPIHTLLIAATDNFYSVVPVTGLNFSKGLLIAVSTTPALYTDPGAKEVTLCGTLLI